MLGLMHAFIRSLKARMVVEKRKIFRILILLVLLPGILINGVMAEACLCIEPCSFGLQDGMDAKENSPFHSHHANAHCKICNVEDGQTLKAAVSSTSIGNIKFFDTTSIIFILTDFHSHNQIHKGFIPRLYDYGIDRSLPVYLQNLSILC
ncbi:MAG: hypothetical protein HN416_17480 [Nitrospina sp.]|jgi:hypothetical protein|nr:hypothetical protein [Nitrospina sp.]